MIWLLCVTAPGAVASIFTNDAALLLPHLWPDAVTGVYLAEPIADATAVCTAAPMFYHYYSKLK